MKNLLLILIGIGFLSACSSQKRIPTFKEAVSQNEDLESGIYNKKNGENVSVEVKSMRSAIEEAEKRAYEAKRESEYLRLRQQETEYENLLLRARGNYKLEKQVNEIEGFDRQHNPVIRQKIQDREPAQRQDQGNLNQHRQSRFAVTPRPAPSRQPLPEQPVEAPHPVVEAPQISPESSQIAQDAANSVQDDPIDVVADSMQNTAQKSVQNTAQVAAPALVVNLPKPLVNQ